MTDRRTVLSWLALAAAAVPLAAAGPPARAQAGAAAGRPRELTWEQLVPADWDPMKEFRGMDIATLQDGDPRAQALLERLRKVWDAAPPNPALDGQLVRLPGYVVPLDDGSAGLREFLLVPYFGACIHSPPPPANQIVHVLPAEPARGVRSMDTVWVSGRMSTVRTDSYMGVATYRIDAQKVEPYKAPAAPAPAR